MLSPGLPKKGYPGKTQSDRRIYVREGVRCPHPSGGAAIDRDFVQKNSVVTHYVEPPKGSTTSR